MHAHMLQLSDFSFLLASACVNALDFVNCADVAVGLALDLCSLLLVMWPAAHSHSRVYVCVTAVFARSFE